MREGGKRERARIMRQPERDVSCRGEGVSAARYSHVGLSQSGGEATSSVGLWEADDWAARLWLTIKSHKADPLLCH